MHRITPIALICAAAPAAADAPRVATDIAPVHSLVSMVMEGVGEPDLIVPQGASPHHHSLRPSEAAALNGADLVIRIGEGLAPAVDRAVEALAGGTDIHLSDTAETLLESRDLADFGGGDEHDHDEEHDEHGHDEDHDEHDHDEEHDEHGHDEEHDEHDHEEEHDEHGHEEDHDEHGELDAHGHDHGGQDPHLWLDPINAIAWLGTIEALLSEQDPENASVYAENAAAAVAALEAQTARIATEIEALPEVSFVIYHDAYNYFESRFGIEASGAVSLGDGAAPGLRHVQELRERMVEEGVVCFLVEPGGDGQIAENFGDDLRVVEADPLGLNHEPGPDLYPALLNDLSAAFTECMGGDSDG